MTKLWNPTRKVPAATGKQKFEWQMATRRLLSPLLGLSFMVPVIVSKCSAEELFILLSSFIPWQLYFIASKILTE